MLISGLFLLWLFVGSNAQRDGTDCVGLVLEASSSPQVLNERTPGANGCQAKIISPSGTTLKISVLESNCVHGGSKELEFYYPGDPNIKMKLCRARETASGASWDLPLTILADNELLLYEEDEELTFKIEYSHVPKVENICNMESALKVGPTPHYVTSPNFGIGPYLNKEKCTVTIKGTSECQIRLEFNSSLENNADVVRVCLDGDDSCTDFGTTEFTTNTFLAEKETTVTFTSDMYGSWYGFMMKYSCVSVFSDWSSWSVTGCEYANTDRHVLFRRRERFRECLVEHCEDEDLHDTRLTLCFETCRRKCCKGLK